MSVTIRDARERDVQEIARGLAGQPLMARYGVATSGLEKNLAGALRREEDLIVAELEGKVVGMAWFLRSGTFAIGGYLRLISVFPGMERQGLGAVLLAEMERRTASESRFVFLLVSSHNEGARRFYAAHGYAESGTLPELVRPGIDEVIMWKRLRAA